MVSSYGDVGHLTLSTDADPEAAAVLRRHLCAAANDTARHAGV